MKHVRLLGMALLALMAITSAVSTATASANLSEFVFLEAEKAPIKFEGTAGEGKLETLGKSAIKCTSATVKGEAVNATDGNATFTFKGCTSSGFNCNTVGEAAGTIVSKGLLTPVVDSRAKDASGLLPALLLTVAETKVECTALVKITVKGNLLILFKEKLTSGAQVEKAEFDLKQKAGEPEDKKYWEKEEGEAAKEAKLECSTNGGAFETCADESANNKVTYKKMVADKF